MKIIIDDFEIELKVKRTGEKRCNKLSAMYFLNYLSLLFYDSGLLKDKQYKESQKEYTKAVSNMRYDEASKIHDFLNNMGFYDDLND